MKIIITGSLGHISLPVTKSLAAAGHYVTVISNNAQRAGDIENIGAQAAIGSVTDTGFLTDTFRGADVVYLMVPNDFGIADFPAFQRRVGDNYVHALKAAGVPRVVLLSSIGADLREGAGPIDALGYLEAQLEALDGLHLQILRPSYFFYNLHAQAGLIRHAGIAGSNFGDTDEKLVLAHTDDIAEVATKQLLDAQFTGKSITYIASDERHPQEIAQVLGRAAGRENLPWVTFTDEQALEGMIGGGLPEGFAKLYVSMGQAIRSGNLQRDYWQHRPVLGSRKLEDFAQEFAAAYASEPAIV